MSNEVRDYLEQRERTLEARVAALERAVSLMQIGGNHLAHYLIGNCGASFSTDFPPGTKHGRVREAMSQNDYDVWCCWSAIMRARNNLE